MFKKALAIILCMATVLTASVLLVACGDRSDDGGDKTKPTSVTCTVSFDSDGGTAVKSMTVKQGDKIDAPEAPTKADLQNQYSFLGWYDGDEKWDFANGVVKSDLRLVAKWKLEGAYTVGFKPQQ